MTPYRQDLRPLLHVVASTDRRGAETAAVALAEALDGQGCGGRVVALAPGAQGGLELPVLGASRFSRATLRRLRGFAMESSAVVAHGSSTLPAVSASTVGLSVPFVYRSIGDPSAWIDTPARRLRVSAASRRAAMVVALWREAAVRWHELTGVRPERITVIPNGSDPERFRPPSGVERRKAREALGLPVDGTVLLSLGALTREKRVDLAIRSASVMGDVTMVVVGSGPEHDRLVSLADELGGDGVRFFPATDRPEEALRAADLLLLTSDTEGQPAVAIEAGLTGLPVVATRVGGVPEIVLDGHTGVLIEKGDPSNLTTAVQRCLRNRAEMGSHARAHCVANFSIEQTAEQWAELLQSVIKR